MLYLLAETTMSDPYLPAEIPDQVTDHLHDTLGALRNCCLVSKSWTPRTRKHLFANTGFHTAKRLQSWKETFPDPSTSPAHYAETLSVSCRQVLTAADADAGWIKGFCRVVQSDVNGVSASYPDDPVIYMIDRRSWLLDVVLRAGKWMESRQSPATDDALLTSYIPERTSVISRSARTPTTASSPCDVRPMVFQINNQFTISRTIACHLQPVVGHRFVRWRGGRAGETR